MTEEQGYVVELILDLGFKMTNDDGDEYACTEQQLLTFAWRIAEWARKDPSAFRGPADLSASDLDTPAEVVGGV